MRDKKKVLFLCTGNSARSQMAEALLKKYAGEHYEVYSAGLAPTDINPLTYQVMNELGIELDNQSPKGVERYLGKEYFYYVVSLCRHAEQNCPRIFLTHGEVLHWDLEDPSSCNGTEEEKLNKFREIRDQIGTRIQNWLSTRLR
ncbi:MAG: arsenate reductase ArsC [Candidatus Electrothrix sp. ATG2]|nr:arsenate reductase ArsC [Candidatus Electrothrix sp. ATG2]